MEHPRLIDQPNVDYQRILEDIAQEVRPLIGSGKVADYIPALATVPAHKFGMAVVTITGESYCVGEAEEAFSIQSISKVFTLTLASRYVGGKLWRRLGREASGNQFNSLVQLEYEHGIPRNPFINAGALVVADVVISHSLDANQEIKAFVETLAGKAIDYDELVAQSEREHGYRNLALVSFMKSFGNIENPIEAVLDVYFTSVRWP